MVNSITPPVMAAVGLLVVRWLAQLTLAALNRQHVCRHADRVPDAFVDVMDAATYAKSVAYTLAKNRLHRVEVSWDGLVLALALGSGVLPWVHDQVTRALGTSVWAGGAFLFVTGAVLSLLSLPLDWYAQFRLETRFGFSTMTWQTWVADRIKGFVLAVLLGYPLIVLILQAVHWVGDRWWILAWAVVMGFQWLMMVLAPALILPWFNKFTPLPDGSLKERLWALAVRTGFRATSIQVMDGSRRSRHSNAFFTGVGRWRKIVLFDTLLEQLTEPELEAVLAHEIGHYHLRHVRKLMLLSSAGLLGGLYAVSLLAAGDGLARAFGFASGGPVPALLLSALLAGPVTFWMIPLANLVSRRFEYEADRYAAQAMRESSSLIGALRKLAEKNLGNLTPHPVYSRFYYSHPTLAEREAKLRTRLGSPGYDSSTKPLGEN